jgi:DNA polymerase-3 subunit epsilon
VAASITKQTTLLVVGESGRTKQGAVNKSTKLRRAEQLIGKGQNIRILNEAEFMTLCTPRVSFGTVRPAPAGRAEL